MPDGICDITDPNDPDCVFTETPPVSANLQADPQTVTSGDLYTLSWSTTNAVCVYLNGQPVGDSGSETYVAPDVTETQSETYELVAYGGTCGDSSNMISLVVIVTIEPPPAPVAP